MLEFDNSIAKYLEKSIKKEDCITHEELLTNCIITSKRLIIEIESMEDKILKDNNKNLNKLLIIGAQFEQMIQKIKILSDNYLIS